MSLIAALLSLGSGLCRTYDFGPKGVQHVYAQAKSMIEQGATFLFPGQNFSLLLRAVHKVPV